MGYRTPAALTLVLAAGLTFTTGAQAKTRTCGNSTGGSAGVIDTFSHIKVNGASCSKAHEVLGTFANSAPGGTDLGFTCLATKTGSDTFTIKCREGSKSIDAHEKQKL